MNWYYWFALGGLIVCLLAFSIHFVRLVRLGRPKDHSEPSGSTTRGIVYSFTSGMNPLKKESAFLHLPTYTAGIVLHLAIFMSLVVFMLLIAGVRPGPVASFILGGGAFAGTLAGMALLVKRMASRKLRLISNPDDYLSAFLVIAFLAFTGLVVFVPLLMPGYMLAAGILFLYMPLGKLKHVLYFFAARYHLGYFYGWRNVWPPPKA